MRSVPKEEKYKSEPSPEELAGMVKACNKDQVPECDKHIDVKQEIPVAEESHKECEPPVIGQNPA